MEFVGEITRADGEVTPVYVNNATFGKVTMVINAAVHTMEDGDSLTISRTK